MDVSVWEDCKLKVDESMILNTTIDKKVFSIFSSFVRELFSTEKVFVKVFLEI